MAVHFHLLKVKEIKKETPDSVSVCFDIPSELRPLFIYKEGQNITLKKTINGQELRRSYSICTAPYENELRVAIKKVEGGLFSYYASHELKKGDELEVLPPTGRFQAHLTSVKTPRYLAIAAGSGITPILSIIKHSLQTQQNSEFTLLYGNKNRSSIIFFDELEALKNKYMDRFKFINILSKEKTEVSLFNGRIDKEKLEACSKLISFSLFDSVYLCGPESLIFTARDFLQHKNVPVDHIYFELFTVPGQNTATRTETIVSEKETGPQSNVPIKLDGRSFNFNLPFKGQNVLDAALQQGADLPYACKGGVCCTCRAKLIKGKVSMDVNYALEPEELAQGFILTCQSHPTTDEVVIDFDLK